MDLVLQSDGKWDVIAPVQKIIPTADKSKVVEAKGTIQADDLHVFLRQETLQEIIDYSKTNLSEELGGVMPGTLYEHRGIKYIEMHGYIRAAGESGRAQYKFTHDAWSLISRERETRFNDAVLVGWHHTHPGYGVFLSHYDRFIHGNFFNLPWQVALVVDPRADTLGFFQWKDNEIRPVGFFFVK